MVCGSPAGAPHLTHAFLRGAQLDPALTVRSDGAAVLVWSSQGQDGSGLGVFSRRLSASGETVVPGATP